MLNMNTNLNIYITNIPKQERVVSIMQSDLEDTYVFCAPETI